MAWQPDTQIGAYTITERIGSGGMATVYRAHHKRLARDVAIKVMHAAYQADADFLARFDREAKIVAGLDHPHIVPIYDFADMNGQPYLVVKYIEGGTLKDLLADHAPPLAQVIEITRAVAEALTYAHSRGVLHRDVKPSNVMIDPNGTPYLTDFGLARLVQTGESTLSAGMIVGTPNYVSPEQAEGLGEVTTRADVYSLGVMLYEMVVGRLPFLGATPYATIHMHIYDEPSLPSEVNPEIPVEVELVLLRALEKDPAARHPTPEALATDFEQAVARAGLTALSADRSGVHTPQPRTPSPRPSKPKRDPGDQTALLLLEDEQSWAHLPREQIVARRLKKRRDERFGIVAHAVPYVIVNALIISQGWGDGFNPGALAPALGWGAGLVAHALSVYFGERQPVERLYTNFDAKMTDRYGEGWRWVAPQDEIQKAWQVTQSSYENLKNAVTHTAVYVLINLLIWAIWFGALQEAGQWVFPFPLVVMAGWGIGLAANWLEVRSEARPFANDESIRAELDIMEGGSTPRRKLKRAAETLGDDVRLTDDGELTESAATQRRNTNQ